MDGAVAPRAMGWAGADAKPLKHSVDYKAYLRPTDCKGRTIGAYTSRAYTSAITLAKHAGHTVEDQKRIGREAYQKAVLVFKKHGA